MVKMKHEMSTGNLIKLTCGFFMLGVCIGVSAAYATKCVTDKKAKQRKDIKEHNRVEIKEVL